MSVMEAVALSNSHADLIYAQQLLNEKGPAAMYEYLKGFNLPYSELALGLVNESSVAGQAAISNLKEVAAQNNIAINIEAVKFSMADAYLNALVLKQSQGDFGEISAEEAWAFHKEVFESDFHLPSSAWTMDVPFSVMTEAERASIWQRTLNSAGSADAEIVLSLEIAAMVSYKAGLLDGLSPDEAFARDMAELSQKPGQENSLTAQQKSAVLAWLDINAWSTSNIANMSESVLKLLADRLNDNHLYTSALPIELMQSLFGGAERLASPLILDLDGDGVETVGLGSGVKFDHDGNKFAESTGWVGADDGLLVIDRNGNGSIDSGSELFGNNTALKDGKAAANGFAALAEFDSNADGVIDGSDAQFSALRVWKDINGNGVADSGELLTLKDVGVASIKLGYTDIQSIDANGNHHLQAGTFTNTQGLVSAIEDVWFKVDYGNSQEVDIDAGGLTGNGTIDALPQVSGSGNVHNLRTAMQNDTSGQLTNLVQQFAAATDRDDRRTLMDQILYRWSGASAYAAGSRGNNVADARQLYTIEAFLGESYSQGNWGANPGPQAAALLSQSYQALRDSVYAQLMLQTHLIKFTDLFTLDGSNGLTWDISGAVDALKAIEKTDRQLALDLGLDLIQSLKSAWGTSSTSVIQAFQSYNDLGDSALSGLFGIADSSTVLLGTSAADVLTAVGDTGTGLLGYQGDDTLKGGAGSDILTGGTGNDALYGGGGSDRYVFNLGDGNDTIYERDSYSSSVDVLAFGQGILPSDITVLRQGNDVVFKLRNGQDSVRISSWLTNSGELSNAYGVERIVFADGTEWTVQSLLSNGLTTLGTVADDTIDGWRGKDVIVGGLGNDTLRGAAGPDVYQFSKGDGQDVIIDSDSTAGTIDAIAFTDVRSSEITQVERAGSDLIIRYGQGDSVTVRGHYESSTANRRVEAVRFADGVEWTLAELAKLVVGTSANDTFTGYSNIDNTIRGLGGNDELTGGDFHDELFGGMGNDTLNGGDGNDTLYGEADADTLNGGAGADLLVGGTGNDLLQGAVGADVYRFSKGDGLDRIYESDTTIGVLDTVEFTNVASSEIKQVEHSGEDLIIRYGSGDAITVASHYNTATTSRRIERVRFSDGVEWTLADLARMVVGTSGNDTFGGYTDVENVIRGLEGKDVLSGGDLHDELYGGDGADTLNGGAGDDALFGEADADSLSGGSGADVLIGGAGNDVLQGGTGSDTYKFSKGDGLDQISDSDSTTGVIDTIEFTDVVSSEITQVEHSGDDLIIRYGANDVITVAGHYITSSSSRRIERVRFSDGIEWTIADLAKQVVGTSGNDNFSGYSNVENIIKGLAGADTIAGGDLHDELFGGDGNDTLNGGDGNDLLYGEADTDTLNGGAGIDLLVGGSGQDLLQGGTGDDTYRFSKGDGVDKIFESDATTGVIDTIEFTDVESSEIAQVEHSGDDLIIRYGSGDAITVSGHYLTSTTSRRIERIKFSDGVEWALADLAKRVVGTNGNDSFGGYSNVENVIRGLAGNDTLGGGDVHDELFGGDGDDTLNGNSGDDSLYGEGGVDTLNGGGGADLLIGGVGNDLLQGGVGADLYRFSKGDGVDKISDVDSSTGIVDTIEFTDVASSEMTQVEHSGDNLILRYGTSDAITVEGHFVTSTASRRVEKVRFSDGVEWGIADLAKLVVGTAGDDTFGGYTNVENVIHGLGGKDTLTGGDLRDEIYGGDGADTLNGGSGNDTLYGEADADTLNGGNGSDLLVGGVGNDLLQGGAGGDLYRFQLGDGADRINDADSTSGVIDTIEFSDILQTGLTEVEKSGSDLILHYGTADTITVEGHFNTSTTSRRVEKVVFADGSQWSVADLASRAVVHPAATGSSSSLSASTQSTNFYNQAAHLTEAMAAFKGANAQADESLMQSASSGNAWQQPLLSHASLSSQLQ